MTTRYWDGTTFAEGAHPRVMLYLDSRNQEKPRLLVDGVSTTLDMTRDQAKVEAKKVARALGLSEWTTSHWRSGAF